MKTSRATVYPGATFHREDDENDIFKETDNSNDRNIVSR